MTRRITYLALLFASLYFTSLLIQNAPTHPAATLAAAREFKLVTAGFCVNHSVGSKWSITAMSGEVPKGSVGLLASKTVVLNQGDCLTARMQLSPVDGFSRFAFKASLRQVSRTAMPSEKFAAINQMRKYAASFRGDSANLVSGLAVGIDQGLSAQFLTNMQATGLTHLTAVSGANCAIVIGAFWLLARSLRLGRNLRVLLSAGALLGYVTLVGPQPSVLRAAFMISVVGLALEFGRRIWIPAALALGSAVLLIVDPWLVIDYGFWLSVLATYGLVILTPAMTAKFETSMPKYLAIGLSATIAAQLWCLPVLATLQGGITTYSLLANVLVEPAVPLITILGVLACVIGPWVPMGGQLLMWLGSVPASWIVYVANSLANSPSPLLTLPAGGLGFVLIAIFVLSLSRALLRGKFSMLVVSASLVLIWFGGQLFTFGHQLKWPLENWTIVACDVGQGDALVIRSAGKIAVVDVGKDNGLIDQCLDRLQVTRVDLLVLTHFDNDHVGALAGLQRGRVVERVLISAFPDARMSSVQGGITADSGLSGHLGEFTWVVISSLGPYAQNANEGSLGIRFESPELVLYTLADLNEVAQTKALSLVGDSSKPTVVKVSHHGSADQSQAFYQSIGADVALISVGKGNSYGHPTGKLISLLKDNRMAIFRTDLQGSISLRVQGGAIEAGVAGAG